ncbi:MAG: HAMP domain-containing histidine kinase, partial [Caulobacteraceae bacterium]|nr:HAMP domain-containing histidine kinase [Caulobacter sp.]
AVTAGTPTAARAPAERGPAPARLGRLRLVQTTAFRWMLGSAAVVALGIVATGGFFYEQTVGYLTSRLDAGLRLEARSLAVESRRVLVLRLEKSLAVDPHGTKAYGLFAADGARLAGDVAALPARLPPPDRPSPVTVDWDRAGAPEPIEVRAIALHLADGATLFLGRSAADIDEIDEIVKRAMALTAGPAALLALVGGALVSLGTLRRVEAVRHACALVMGGEFSRRLPVGRRRDEFDRLSEMVNRMLDEIERLVEEVRGAGDAIAHDLRTPLTRLRARLDRALDPAARHAPVEEVLGKSVADLDQLLATVTAVLRLAEVEEGRRQGGFRDVDLGEIVDAVGELYGAVAEDKGVALEVARAGTPAPLRGDGDLLFEAVANLVDNAVKYTPAGGRVGLELSAGPLVRVWDTGPGIAPEDRAAVMRRFYRVDRSRHLPGTGLGLSLVAAIARLHGFGLTIGAREGGGCDVRMGSEDQAGGLATRPTADRR